MTARIVTCFKCHAIIQVRLPDDAWGIFCGQCGHYEKTIDAIKRAESE